MYLVTVVTWTVTVKSWNVERFDAILSSVRTEIDKQDIWEQISNKISSTHVSQTSSTTHHLWESTPSLIEWKS